MTLTDKASVLLAKADISLIEQSKDWEDIIAPGLDQLGALLAQKGMVANKHQVNILSTAFAAVYTVGYRSGQTHPPICFTVVEPDKQGNQE